MSTFSAILLQVLNRFLCRRNLIIFGIILIVSLIAVLSSISSHEATVAKEKEFLKMEAANFNNFLNYLDYSKSGINIFFYPSAASVLFANPVVMSELVAHIDTVITVNIHSNCQGSVLFQQNSYFRMRLSSVLLILASLLTLFIAYDSLRELEYLKFLASASSEKAVYLSILLSRFLLVILSFLSILFFALCIMSIKGIYLNKSDFVGMQGFLIGAVVMLMFFFLLGTAIGKIRSQGIGIAVLLAIWIVLVLLMPGVFDSIIEGKANNITSYYKVYNDKLTVVNNFEKQASERGLIYGKTSMDVLRNEVKRYLNNEYKAIKAIEEKLKEEIRQVIKFSNQLYNLLPSTFYLSTANEASSRGYRNFDDFYSYLLELQRQFVEFWMDRVYYNDPKVMVNFVKKDENVFKAKSAVPFYFSQGVIINLGYCIILFFLSFFLYKRALCPHPKKASAFKDIAMNFVPGDLTEIKVYHKEFTTQFLNVFFGKINHFTGKLSVDADTIVTNEKKDFLYLPPKEQIPGDLKVKTFLSFSKRLLKASNEEFENITAGLDKAIFNKTFEKLEPIDKARVLLTAAQMKKSPVYIIDTIITGIPEEDQKIVSDIVQGVKTDDTVIINFSNETGFWTTPDVYKSIRFDGTKYFNLLK